MKNKNIKLIGKSIFIVVIIFTICIFSLGLSSEILPGNDASSDDETTEKIALDVQTYLSENLDSAYIKNNKNSATQVAQLTIKNTYIDSETLAKFDNSLDSFFENVHKTGDMSGYVMTATTLIPLYEIDESSNYVVGILNTDKENEPLDIVFAENNNDGVELAGEHYDEKTGLVYVQKNDLYKVTDDGIYTDYVQVQVLHRYINNDTENSASVSISCGDNVKNITASEDVISPQTEIELAISSESDEKIEKNDIEIKLNGNNECIDASEYDIEDGKLIINTSPANITSASIEIDDTEDIALSSIFTPQTVYAYSTSTNDSSAFPTYLSSAHVGDYCDFTAKWTNSSGKSDNPSTYDAVQVISGNADGVQKDFYDRIIAHDKEATEFITGEYASGKPNVYKPSSSSENTYRDYKLVAKSIKASETAYNNMYLKKWLEEVTCSVSLSCAEVKTAASVADGEINLTAMVSEVGSNYVLVTFCSNQRTEGKSNKTGTGQVLCGTFAIKYSPQYAKINYYANGAKTTSATYSILSSSLLCKDGAVFYDNWELYNTKKYGLYNASDFELYKTGYHFSGNWNTSPDGSGTSYNEDDRKVMFYVAGKVNLYAIWEENETKISYDLDGGVWPGEALPEVIVKYSESFTVPLQTIEEEPKKEGFAFIGWKIEGSDIIYDFTDEVKPENFDMSDTKLVAVWQKATSVDTVYSEYGASKTYLTTDTGDSTIKFILPAKHHYYKFVGYFADDGEQITDEDGIVLNKEVKGIIKDGAFINTSAIKLVARFSSERKN